MSKLLAGIAALSLLGLAAMPITATAAERQSGATSSNAQPTDISAQRYYRRYGYGYRAYPRRYYGPRYGYYGAPYYGYGYPYGYYRPGIALGFGPFGFRAF